MRTVRAVVTVLALLLGGCAGLDEQYGSPGVSSVIDVDRYCEYGSISQAQLDGCKEHVTADDIPDDTNAADYARGDLDECLEDAGPFCE